MKKIIACFFVLQIFGVFADQSTIFSLTPEEMVFASKLSDENRRQFCYKFSFKDRISCLAEAQKKENTCSLDQIVEEFMKADSLEKSLLR